MVRVDEAPHSRHRHSVAAALALATALFAPPAAAINEHVTVSQAPDGTIVATLSGAMFPCSFGFLGPPVVLASGANYDITSNLVGLGCPAVPGSHAAPYSISVSLGTVVDGVHAVTWNFAGATTGAFVAAFTVAGGLLVPPPTIPTLSPLALAALGLLLLLSAHRLRFRPS